MSAVLPSEYDSWDNPFILNPTTYPPTSPNKELLDHDVATGSSCPTGQRGPSQPTSIGADAQPAETLPATKMSSSSVPSSEQFLVQYQSQAFELIQNVYVKADRSLRISANGTLTTNLCEDLIYMLNMQVVAMEEYLAEYDNEMATAGKEEDVNDHIQAEAVTSLLFAMYTRQLAHRDLYLIDIEGCCAAANDFLRLAELVEDWALGLDDRFFLGDDNNDNGEKRGGVLISSNERELPDLVSLYSRDAEYALRLACRYALNTIDEEFASDGAAGFCMEGVCGRRWEEDGTSTIEELDNENREPGPPGAKTGADLGALLRISEEFLSDTEEYLSNEHSYQKITESMMQGIAVHYVDRLLSRAQRVLRKRLGENGPTNHLNSADSILIPDIPFADPAVAARRIAEDIYAFRSFFRPWVLEMPAIDQHIQSVFDPITAMQKCLELAADVTRIGSEGTYDFVTELFGILHENVEMTRKFILDLWGLTIPLGVGADVAIPTSVNDEICRVANAATESHETRAHTSFTVTPRFFVPGLSLHDLFTELYFSSSILCEGVVTVSNPKRVQRLSRKKMVKALKSDFVAAKKKISNVPLLESKKKIKKKAKSFLDTCKQASKLRSKH